MKQSRLDGANGWNHRMLSWMALLRRSHKSERILAVSWSIVRCVITVFFFFLMKCFLPFPGTLIHFWSGLGHYAMICLLLSRGKKKKKWSRMRNNEMSLTRAGIKWEIWVAGCFHLTLASLLDEVFTPTVLCPDTETIPPVWLMHCSAARVEDVSRQSPSPFQYSSLIFH